MNTMHQQSGWSAQEIYFQEQNLLPEYEFVMKNLLCFICYENKRNNQNIGVRYACMLDVAMKLWIDCTSGNIHVQYVGK